jgi:adenosine deaminase
MPRLAHLSPVFPALLEAEADEENVIARLEDLLVEEAEDGAVLAEVRLGPPQALRAGFMELVREAERREQRRYPRLRVEALVTVLLHDEPERLERVVDGCIRAAQDGLGGVDLLYKPYDAEASWGEAYRLAARMANAGLGITAHAGEFSTANIAAALDTPGLSRLGHAVYAAHDPRLLDLVLERGVSVASRATWCWAPSHRTRIIPFGSSLPAASLSLSGRIIRCRLALPSAGSTPLPLVWDLLHANYGR